MLTLWKINSEAQLEWNDDTNDLFTFIVISTVMAHEFGIATYVLSNRKERKAVPSKCTAVGHATLRSCLSFIAVETGIGSLKKL